MIYTALRAVMICQTFGLNKKSSFQERGFLVGEGGFEPPKAMPADLQSVPFGHSGILPYSGAGEGSRTPNLLITNQLLCH